MTVSELVDKFVAVALEQERAELRGDRHKFAPLFWEMDAIEEELKARQGDQRRALVDLYDHPNVQVKLKAAKSTLAVAPGEARRALEAVAASHMFPQAGEAGMSLWNLDRGVFKPT